MRPLCQATVTRADRIACGPGRCLRTRRRVLRITPIRPLRTRTGQPRCGMGSPRGRREQGMADAAAREWSEARGGVKPAPFDAGRPIRQIVTLAQSDEREVL